VHATPADAIGKAPLVRGNLNLLRDPDSPRTMIDSRPFSVVSVVMRGLCGLGAGRAGEGLDSPNVEAPPALHAYDGYMALRHDGGDNVVIVLLAERAAQVALARISKDERLAIDIELADTPFLAHHLLGLQAS